MKRILAIIAVFVVLFLPAITSAQGGIVPCSGVDCDLCDLFQMIVNATEWLMFVLAPILAVMMIVVGGFFFLIGGNDPGKISQGRQILWGTVIGLLLVFGSWMIVNTFLTILGYSEDWSTIEITC